MTLTANILHSHFYQEPLHINAALLQRFQQYLNEHLSELHRYPEEEYPNLITNVAAQLAWPKEHTFIAKSAPELLEFFLEPWATQSMHIVVEANHPFHEIIHHQGVLKGCQVTHWNPTSPLPDTFTVAFVHTSAGLAAVTQNSPEQPVVCHNTPYPEAFPPNPTAFYFEWPADTASANRLLPPVFGWTNDPTWAETLKKIQEPFHIPTQLLALMADSLTLLPELPTKPALSVQQVPQASHSIENILPAIASIKPYIPGKGIKRMSKELKMPESAFSKLASNEHPNGLDAEFINTFQRILSQWEATPTQYADLWQETCKQILTFSGKPNWKPSQVSLGTGSVELIKAIIKAFVPEGGTVMSPLMPFAMYPFETQKRLANYSTVALTDAMETDLNQLIEAVHHHNPQVIFLANPRNPLGTALPSLDPLIEALRPGQVLVIDEAYYDFIRVQMGEDTYPNGLDLIERYPDKSLISLRTFSKGLALASFRLGYALSSEILTEQIQATMLPAPIDPFSMGAALAAMRREGLESHIRQMVQAVLVEKQHFYELFEELGLRYIPSYSNFIYFETGETQTSQTLFDQLVHQGVIIRPVLERSSRVNVGTPEQNQHFIRAMKQVYQGK